MHFIMPRFFAGIERWKWNADLRLYVSTHGHFKDEHKRNKACKVRDNYFWIYANGQWLPAHRVVLLTWRPLPNDGEPMTVDHLNSITRDNRLCNLEWVTAAENKRRARENELPLEKKKKITPRNTIQELPIGVPLHASKLGFKTQDCVPYGDLMNKVLRGDIVFRLNNKDYTVAELCQYFNKDGAKQENFIKRAISRAFYGQAYNNLTFDLIRVK